MESFFTISNVMTKKLGRKLQDEELKFLQWMYERYTEEQLETELEQTDADALITLNS
ncbi:hypothetical protein [Oceanobacillus polygoni]|uniref:Uncharacterized protein n=1 Tax=Oceanobacillus polygoni TaxID=1235259 RepID=A0A9X1CAV4_9BACI|nr:hypothetical protein [Oceanobacillus polygoni]MBP2076271.1 hypothetical protein [Oceanobacillus polygoni]